MTEPTKEQIEAAAKALYEHCLLNESESSCSVLAKAALRAALSVEPASALDCDYRDLLGQVIADTAAELGCAPDNEAILFAIADLKHRVAAYDENAKLPCNVAVAPATIIRKGCDVSTLLLAIAQRRKPELGECPEEIMPHVLDRLAPAPALPLSEAAKRAADFIICHCTAKPTEARAIVADVRAALAVAPVTGNPSTPDMLRTLVAKWRADAAGDGDSNGPFTDGFHGGRSACADELERALLAGPAPALPLEPSDEAASALIDFLPIKNAAGLLPSEARRALRKSYAIDGRPAPAVLPASDDAVVAFKRHFYSEEYNNADDAILAGFLAAYAAAVVPAGPSEEAVPHSHWAVTVSTSGEEIVCIETNCLSGREISEADEATIRLVASHLLAFVGGPYAIDGRPAPAEGWRPIDSAPHGETVLLFEPKTKTGAAHLGARIVAECWPTSYPRKATHWRPLPLPPMENGQ